MASGAATGNLEHVFELRNKSASACWVYGFVGFQPLDGQGRPMRQTVAWSTESFFGTSDPPTRILLPPDTAPMQVREGGAGWWAPDSRGHAFFDVATNDVTCDSSQPRAVTLEIWPPDEFAPLKIPAKAGTYLSFFYCDGIALNPLQTQPSPHQD